MATSKQIKGYAKANNCSTAEAKEHYRNEAKNFVKNFTGKFSKFIKDAHKEAINQEGFLSDAGMQMATKKVDNLQLHTWKLVQSVGERCEQLEAGYPLAVRDEGRLELTTEVNVDGVECCATLEFPPKIWDKFAKELSKNAEKIHIQGVPLKQESTAGFELFRPIKVTNIVVESYNGNYVTFIGNQNRSYSLSNVARMFSLNGAHKITL